MRAQAPCSEIGDGGVRLGLRRDRLQAALDALDDGGGLAPPPVERFPGDGSESDALEAGGSSGLDDVDLAAVALDADAETGEVAVPIEGVPAGGRQGGDAADGGKRSGPGGLGDAYPHPAASGCDSTD